MHNRNASHKYLHMTNHTLKMDIFQLENHVNFVTLSECQYSSFDSNVNISYD